VQSLLQPVAQAVAETVVRLKRLRLRSYFLGIKTPL